MTTAHGIQSAAWLLIAIPAISAAILLLAGRAADKWGHLLGAAVPAVLFVYGVMLFFSVKGESHGNREIDRQLFDWVVAGTSRSPPDCCSTRWRWCSCCSSPASAV